jgi:hypothetical protein
MSVRQTFMESDMSETTAAVDSKCLWCGATQHAGVCPSVKSIEYHENGTVKRVEFRDAPPLMLGGMQPWPYPPWDGRTFG